MDIDNNVDDGYNVLAEGKPELDGRKQVCA